MNQPISKRWRNVTVAIVLLGALACGGPNPTSTQAPSDNATIRVGTFATFETPNDLIARGSQFNYTIVSKLFSSLAREVPEYSQERPIALTPQLATAWEFSEDGLDLIFQLRTDAVWSDGTPVTAEDVVFTHQAATSPEVAWVFADSRDQIVSVEALDTHTVRFRFDQPGSQHLLAAVEGVILPKAAWGQLPFDQWRAQPQWFLDNLVTSGPFLLDQWDRQQRIVLKRNPNYFDPVNPERIVFSIVPDETNLFVQFEAGALDMIYGVRPADVPRLQALQDVEVVDFQTRQYNFLSWNVKRPYFSDATTRRALAFAVDREALVETLWYGYATPADSPIVSWFWAHNNDLEPITHNPEQAATLLSEAGWKDLNGDGVLERDGVEFRFEITTNPGNQTRWDALTLIRAQLADVGIVAELQQIEFNTLNARNLAHDYDASLVAFAMDTSLNLAFAFHTEAIDEGYNFGSYSNAEVDQLIDANEATTDTATKLANLLRIQEILHQDQPLLFLWEPRGFVATRNGLSNVKPTAINEFANLTEWQKTSN